MDDQLVGSDDGIALECLASPSFKQVLTLPEVDLLADCVVSQGQKRCLAGSRPYQNPREESSEERW
jgi:hypothetical protein